MSADNYYFVSKQADGKFAVSHRFASGYYEDEFADREPPMEAASVHGDKDGWQLIGDTQNIGIIFQTYEDAMAAATRRPDWVEPAPAPYSLHATLEEAVMAAHRCVADDQVVEYGVVIQSGLMGKEGNEC